MMASCCSSAAALQVCQQKCRDLEAHILLLQRELRQEQQARLDVFNQWSKLREALDIPGKEERDAGTG